MSLSLWFGGQSEVGFKLTLMVGGVSSMTCTCFVSEPLSVHASRPFTLIFSTAGELVRFDTRTLPLTDTFFESTCTALNVGAPSVKLLETLVASTVTSFLLVPQSSLMVALKFTVNLHALSTLPPVAEVD